MFHENVKMLKFLLCIMQNHVSSPRDNVESRIRIFDKKSPF